MNNVLIVYLENGEKIVSSFGSNKTEKEALESFSSSCSEKIKSFHFVEEADAGCEVYNQYFDKDDSEELVFDTSEAGEHAKGSTIENLSCLFLKEFLTKTKSVKHIKESGTKKEVLHLDIFLKTNSLLSKSGKQQTVFWHVDVQRLQQQTERHFL